MRITKPGKLPEHHSHRATCPVCGCEAEFTAAEAFCRPHLIPCATEDCNGGFKPRPKSILEIARDGQDSPQGR